MRSAVTPSGPPRRHQGRRAAHSGLRPRLDHCAGGGVLIISRGASAPALVNQYLLLYAIAAAVIGGVSLFGGRGSVWGVVIGSLIVGSLVNGLALLNVGPDVVEMTEGMVLLAAVLIDAVARRRSITGYR